ncbi:MAG: lytic transglycosylase domain-containing protein, partial [Acidimicrobiales bacterium]
APTTTAVDQIPLPRTAADLAAALTEAEHALRTAGLDQAAAAPWGRRQQLLYRVLAANPGWADEVLASVDPDVAEPVAANWSARQHLLALVRSEGIHDVLPAWRIETPAPADELLGHYEAASEATGLPWEVLAAINLVETRMGRIGGESSVGAVGPMQFLPSTWAECCIGDPTDDGDAIRGAARYLLDRGAARDLDRAIFGYNNSDHYVGAIRAYAAIMAADPSTYYGYHAWQVLYFTDDGLYLLPEGYDEARPVPVEAWRSAHPDTRYELVVTDG